MCSVPEPAALAGVVHPREKNARHNRFYEKVIKVMADVAARGAALDEPLTPCSVCRKRVYAGDVDHAALGLSLAPRSLR
jgi:hypothetical protein